MILYLPSSNKERVEVANVNSSANQGPKSSTLGDIRIGSVQSHDLTSAYNNPVVLTHVIAEDPDEGENGRVRYKIVDGNKHNYFKIGDSDGNITMSLQDNNYDGIVLGCHVLKLSLSDHGIPDPMESLAWVSKVLIMM